MPQPTFFALPDEKRQRKIGEAVASIEGYLESGQLDRAASAVHFALPTGRDVQWETSVAAQREANIHMHDGVSEEAFVAMRSTRGE